MAFQFINLENSYFGGTPKNQGTTVHMFMLLHSYLEKLINLGQVDPLLGIQLVDVAAVSIHEVQAKAHDLVERHGKGVKGAGGVNSADKQYAGRKTVSC